MKILFYLSLVIYSSASMAANDVITGKCERKIIGAIEEATIDRNYETCSGGSVQNIVAEKIRGSTFSIKFHRALCEGNRFKQVGIASITISNVVGTPTYILDCKLLAVEVLQDVVTEADPDYGK